MSERKSESKLASALKRFEAENGETDVSKFLNQLVRQCLNCRGAGRVHNHEWDMWWKEHEKDWRKELVAGKGPAEPESSTCGACQGLGVELTSEGVMLIRFLKTYWDRVD